MGHSRYLYQLPVVLVFAAAATAASAAALDQAEAPLPRDSAAPYTCGAHDTSVRARTDFSCIGRAQVRVRGEPDAKEHVLASKLTDALRTVTGLIGCVNAGDRANRTPTATLGIR